MKKGVLRFVAIAIYVVWLLPLKAADRVLLGSVRSRLVGKTVMILPNGAAQWFKADQKKSHFEVEMWNETFGTDLAGRLGQIVAVDEYDGLTNPKGTNADDQMVDSWYVIVRLDPKHYVACISDPSAVVMPEFVDVADLEQHAAAAQRFVAGLEGKDLFLSSAGKYYDVGLTPQQAASAAMLSQFNSASLTRFPRATPIRLAGYSYLRELDVLEIRLSLPDGSVAIALGNYDAATKQWGATIYTELPKVFTPRDVRAIQSGSYYVGMPAEALSWSLGIPEKINDYGAGGEQWVYAGGTYVYVKHERVVDSQSLQ